MSVTGSKAVEFNGVEFRADGTTGTTGHGNAALQLHGSGTYTVHNSLFYSNFVGGNVEATGIQLDTTVSGIVNIDSNLFTGSQAGIFSGASWQRGIWSDGTSTDLNITGNSFSNVRSAINLDGYNDATHDVSGNIFVSAGTAISVGIPVSTTYAGIHNNDFQTVNDDFNFQNLTLKAVNIDLDRDQQHLDRRRRADRRRAADSRRPARRSHHRLGRRGQHLRQWRQRHPQGRRRHRRDRRRHRNRHRGLRGFAGRHRHHLRGRQMDRERRRRKAPKR